ncbi:MAG: hypothetical protein WBA13_03210 [Microcoleaceae cyanobacterium]
MEDYQLLVETQCLSIRTRQQGDVGAMSITELKESLDGGDRN